MLSRARRLFLAVLSPYYPPLLGIVVSPVRFTLDSCALNLRHVSLVWPESISNLPSFIQHTFDDYWYWTHVGHWEYRDTLEGTLPSQRPQSRVEQGSWAGWVLRHCSLKEGTLGLCLEG